MTFTSRLATSVLLATLGAAGALAQQADPSAPPPTAHRAHHAPSPEQQVKHLTRRLNLTPAQASQLEPVFANLDQQMQAIRSNGQLTQADARAQIKALHQSTQQQFASILTPAQLQEMKHMRRGPHGPGGWQGGQHAPGGWQGGQSQGQPQPSGL